MTDLSDAARMQAMGPFVIVGGGSSPGMGGLLAGAKAGLLGPDNFAAMERALAYSAARSDIEIYCPRELEGGIGGGSGTWYDTAVDDEDEAEHVNLAVKYLSALKLLRRHPGSPEWVQVLALPEAGND